MTLYRESIATHHEIGNRRGEAEGLDCLAKLLHDTGNEPAAAEAWRQALVIFEELGSSHVLRRAADSPRCVVEKTFRDHSSTEPEPLPQSGVLEIPLRPLSQSRPKPPPDSAITTAK